MKRKNLTWTMVLLMVMALVFPSCLDDNDDDGYWLTVPTAIVTVKPNVEDGSFVMQLDDSTVLVPLNVQQSPYADKEVRAFVNYSQSEAGRSASYDVHVNWLDSVRTKPMALDLGDANVETYRQDPLEILKDWATVVEDGYLTLRFQTFFGVGSTHILNLVKGDNPYEVELYHDAQGDVVGQLADGVIAFRLDQLPDTEGKYVDLVLKWKSFTGDKSATFKYCTRK